MELTDKNYINIIKNNTSPIFVDFYSPTCSPCQILTKLIDERLEAYGKENGIIVVKCDISRNPKLAEAHPCHMCTYLVLSTCFNMYF